MPTDCSSDRSGSSEVEVRSIVAALSIQPDKPWTRLTFTGKPPIYHLLVALVQYDNISNQNGLQQTIRCK